MVRLTGGVATRRAWVGQVFGLAVAGSAVKDESRTPSDSAWRLAV